MRSMARQAAATIDGLLSPASSSPTSCAEAAPAALPLNHAARQENHSTSVSHESVLDGAVDVAMTGAVVSAAGRVDGAAVAVGAIVVPPPPHPVAASAAATATSRPSVRIFACPGRAWASCCLISCGLSSRSTVAGGGTARPIAWLRKR